MNNLNKLFRFYNSPSNLNIKSCTDIHSKKCCNCLFGSDELNDCYKNYGLNCLKLAKTKCNECGAECENVCNEIYGNSPEITEYNSEYNVGNVVSPFDSGSGNACSNLPANICKECLLGTGSPPSQPLDVLYRHTGCHFIWFPPEFAFGNDATVPQCTAFTSTNESISCQPYYQYFSTTIGAQDVGNIASVCYSPSPQGWPNLPCSCRRFGHLRGGIYDTVYKKSNISTKKNQGGYLPFMNPFTVRMNISEIGCCWCASPQGDQKKFDDVRARTSYPFASQKYIEASGVYCSFPDENPNPNLIYTNPNYNTSCFDYEISPYLQRVALQGFNNTHPYKCGYDIWTFGGKTNQYKNFGPVYSASRIFKKPPTEGFPEYDISYNELSGVKNKLNQNLVGFVSLEHHFEAWATRSNDGAKHPNLPPNLNHGNVITDPFEVPYAATFVDGSDGGQKCLFYPDEALRHSLIRTTPRRFMYAGSQIPIFHFDLNNFKNYSIDNDYYIGGDHFNPQRFLKGFYNYFYSITEYATNAVPTPPNIASSTLLDDYNYVTSSLEGMIIAGIIRIKDHAIDIAKETKEVIDSATIDSDGNLVLDPYTSAIVGGTAGYINLKTFLGITSSNDITPALIKSKLGGIVGAVSTDGSQANDGYDLFPFPRRATLPVYLEGGRVVNWGCKNNNCCIGNPNLTPSDFDPDINVDNKTKWLTSSITKIFTGLNTNWYLTYNGKIALSGYYGGGLLNIPEDISIKIDDESGNSNINYGSVIKLGGKGQNFEIALIEYPTYFDENNYCFSENDGICQYTNGGDNCGRVPPPERNPNGIYSQYRLRSWGDNCIYGVFGSDLADVNYINKNMVWSDVANGCKHTIAMECEGFVFVAGDNTFEQKKYCYERDPNALLGLYLPIHANKAIPGFINEGEFHVSTNFDYSNSNTGIYNETTYINLNSSQNCNLESVGYKDARCSLLYDSGGNLITDNLPIFTKIGSGYYHNIAIQSDNQVRVWGKYMYIDASGDPITTENSIHETFVPNEVKQLADQWTVLYENTDFPYVATSVTKTFTHSQNSNIIYADGGPDYTIVATKNTIYVWGRKEMLPNYNKDIDNENSFGSYSKSFSGEISKITAGINGFAVIYDEPFNTSTSAFSKKYKAHKTFIWTRKGQDNCGLIPSTDSVKSDFGYSDIAFGSGHAVALKYGTIKSPIWDYNDFQDPIAKNAQFGLGSNGIPRYFKRQAFFRAVPGYWDFSKWIYGAWCNFKITDVDHPAIQIDKCSVLAQPDPTEQTGVKDAYWSYSGHPEYWWPSTYYRRYQQFVPNHSVQPSPHGCNTYGAFGDAGANTLKGDPGYPGCPEKSDICWQATGIPQTRSTETWAPQSSNCEAQCKKTCEGGYCYRNCCPDSNDTVLWANCTSSIGRIGFNGNQDYFIQSYKSFSRVDQCCRCVFTNISYVTYAMRLNYFGYDKTSRVYSIKYNKNPYRYFSSPQGTDDNPNNLGGSEQIPLEENPLPGINLNSTIEYPRVYCGGGGYDVEGGGLGQVENSFYSAYYGIQNQDNPCDEGSGSCIITDPYYRILGPGGWIWYNFKDDENPHPPIIDGEVINSVFSGPSNQYAPVLSPYALLGAYTYGGIKWGDYYLFDPDNQNAYAGLYDSLSTKWHRIGVERNDFWKGLVFARTAFEGGNNTKDDVLVENHGNGFVIVKANDLTCSQIQDP